MLIVNYIHKLQGLDKVLPLLLRFKERNENVAIITILDLEERALYGFPSDLYEILCSISDQVVNAPQRPKFAFIKGRCRRFLISVTDLLCCPINKKFLQKNKINISAYDKVMLLCINSAHMTHFGRFLIGAARSEDGVIVSYMKSVNDRGHGLSVTGNNEPCPSANWYNYLILPNQAMRDIMLESGYSSSELVVVGHPPFYHHWVEYLSSRSCVKSLRTSSSFHIVVFSRGPAPHKPDDNQIITRETERDLLFSIASTINKIIPDAVIWIKPHPYQDRVVIDEVSSLYSNVRVVEYSVHTLAAAADAAVSIYSSAALDVLAFGKPSIEYFVESEAFLRVHPKGSTFNEYGVYACRRQDEFEVAISALLNDGIRVNPDDVFDRFGHVDNFSQLEYLIGLYDE